MSAKSFPLFVFLIFRLIVRFEKVFEYILFDLGSALGRARFRSSDDAHEDKGPYERFPGRLRRGFGVGHLGGLGSGCCQDPVVFTVYHPLFLSLVRTFSHTSSGRYLLLPLAGVRFFSPQSLFVRLNLFAKTRSVYHHSLLDPFSLLCFFQSSLTRCCTRVRMYSLVNYITTFYDARALFGWPLRMLDTTLRRGWG